MTILFPVPHLISMPLESNVFSRLTLLSCNVMIRYTKFSYALLGKINFFWIVIALDLILKFMTVIFR